MYNNYFNLYNKNRTLIFKYNNKYFNLKRNKNHYFILKQNNLNYINDSNINFHNNLLKNNNDFFLHIIHKKSKFMNNIINNKFINIVLIKENKIIYKKKYLHYKDININYSISFFKNINKYKVISILDDFSNTIYDKEFQNFPLNPNIWKKQFNIIKPDLFLVESVWNSILSNFNLSYSNNINLFKEIIQYCKEKKIKTLFWNKEDSINFDKFIWIAKLFPNIATTDNNCVSKYIYYSKHKNVFVLPFGITPSLHNPFNKNNVNSQDILFAGRWYYGNEFSDRVKDMNILFQDFKFLYNKKLVIFDRNYNKLLNKKSFPNHFLPFLKESVDYNTICLLYRYFKILYNVNSVQKSDTMFSRRVLESIACKTFVLSAYSKALENFKLKSIYLSYNNNQTKKITNYILKNYKNLLIQIHYDFIQVYKYHTVNNKLQNIFFKMNLPFCEYLYKVFLIYFDDENINNIIKNHNNQNYDYKYSILLKKTDQEFSIKYIDFNIYIIYYKELKELNYIFDKSILFLNSLKLNYYKNYIDNYLLQYKYLLYKINLNNTIISKSNNENNSNKFFNKANNGTISFFYNEKLFNKLINKNFNNIKIYNIDCYDYINN